MKARMVCQKQTRRGEMKGIPDLRSKFNVAKKQQGRIRMGRDNLRLLYLFFLPTKISLTVKLPGFHFSHPNPTFAHLSCSICKKWGEVQGMNSIPRAAGQHLKPQVHLKLISQKISSSCIMKLIICKPWD